MEVAECNASLAARAGCEHARLKGGERDAHIRRMRGNAMFAHSQDRMHPIDSGNRGTAAARLALIAGRSCIVEIEATRALQEIAPCRSHIAQLRRGTREDRTREQWIARLDLRAKGKIAIGDQCADPQSAVRG